MNYYYFKIRYNHPRAISIFTEPVDTELNRNFMELTSEQIDFYLEHPTASIQEIERCELNPPYVPPEPDIEEVRQQAISDIDRMSRVALGKKVDVLGFCDALASSVYKPSRQDSIYTDDEVLRTADDFLRIGKVCREKVGEVVPRIEEAASIEYIEQIVEDTRQFFDWVVEPVDNLESHKRQKIHEIEVYDISESVNGFFLGDTLLWLDKDTRTGLVNTLNSAAIVGREQVNIWFSGLYITLNIDEARQLLAALEIYATDCYNVTALHKVQVNELETIEEVDNFDVTADYPERLVFNLANR